MNIEPQCINCIFNQAFKVTRELGLDKALSKKILDRAGSLVAQFSYDKTPPQNALQLYQDIATILHTKDIYHKQKQNAIKEAKSLLPFANSLLDNLDDRYEKFVMAMRIAIAGNVIDLASEVEFDLKEELQNIINTNLAIDDSFSLYEGLKESKTISYLADNAGENEFDKLFMKVIKELYHEVEIYYFVRSKPIINDICYEDIKDDKELQSIANIVDSGCLTPGIVIEDMNKEAREIFDKSDLIISKGMGNYECLSNYKIKNLFYLLKVKCEVVANSLSLEVGDIICKN